MSENGLIVEEDAYASRLCATQFLVSKTLLQTLLLQIVYLVSGGGRLRLAPLRYIVPGIRHRALVEP